MSEPEKFGTYLVYELLGKGGMATVHRAESLSAGGFRKRVAFKRLLPHLLDEPEVTESFARETKLASQLRHQNIAQTYDLGILNGTYFIAMELVPGPTLRQVMRQCETSAGAMPIVHVLEILIQVCDALDYAHNLVDDRGHALGIVHRDVTPANIIVSGSGVVKLIDFGLAKVNASRATKAGIIKGKLGYMAPEYTLGRLDHRADLFAVGVIAHEMLTGKKLFDHPNEYEIIKMLREMPIQPPSRWNPSVTLALDEVRTPTPVKRRKDPTPPTVVGSRKLEAVVGGKRSPQDTTGVVVGHSGKGAGKKSVLPVQHTSTSWGRLLFLIFLLLATAGGAYWY